MSGPVTIIKGFFPSIPAEAADELVCQQAQRVLNHARWLNLVLCAGVPGALYMANPQVPFVISTVMPIIVGCMYILGFISLSQTARRSFGIRGCRKIVRDAITFPCIIAVMCSIWCVTNWWYAPVEQKAYFPIVLAMGSLSTAFCLSNIRVAAILNTTIGILPISILMLSSGSAGAIVAAIALLVASAFLIRMLLEQHISTVDLILLQNQLRDLAAQDPLTGIGNRRAFDEALTSGLTLAQRKPDERKLSVALIDLNDFKPINDKYGHPIGDALLREVAKRIEKAVGKEGHVSRLGGDEFAVILPHDSALCRDSLATMIMTSLVKPTDIEGHPITVSASAGVAHYPADGKDERTLLEVADFALYATKSASKSEAQPHKIFAASLSASTA